MLIIPKASLYFERKDSSNSSVSLSTPLGLLGIGTSLSNPYTLMLAIGSFFYSEWDSSKKDKAMEALNEKANRLEVTAQFFEQQGELFRAGLFKAALALYKASSDLIKAAEALQQDIDNADSETNISDLESRRDALKKQAAETFQEGLDAEYLARHGRERPKMEENDDA